jgi:hypothetical protein
LKGIATFGIGSIVFNRGWEASMRARICTSSLGVAALAVLLMGDADYAMAKKQLTGGGCFGSTVTFWPLAAKLNQVYHCPKRGFCPGGQLGRFQMKTIAIYADIQQWLTYTYNTNTTYTVPQQNAIIQNAVNLANGAAVVGTFVYDIQFFSDIAVGNNTQYVIGAHITYASCVTVTPIWPIK